jgi:hypothetical protein
VRGSGGTGDQVGGALGALDGGDAGNADHVALLVVAGQDARQGGGLHHDAAFGAGDAAGFGFGGDVHHVGLALGVEVGEGVALGGVGEPWRGRVS